MKKLNQIISFQVSPNKIAVDMGQVQLSSDFYKVARQHLSGNLGGCKNVNPISNKCYERHNNQPEGESFKNF